MLDINTLIPQLQLLDALHKGSSPHVLVIVVVTLFGTVWDCGLDHSAVQGCILGSMAM